MLSRNFIYTSLLVAASVVATPFAKRAVTLPPLNGKADYQLGGAYTPASSVRVVHRDRTDSPAPAPVVYNICYVNAFQTQASEFSFWNSATNQDLMLRKSNGQLYEDDNWPGEFLLDTSTSSKRTRIATILNGWITECKNKGYNAIEPDNLDTFTRKSVPLINSTSNLQLAALFTTHAHSLGLAVAQKNTGSELGSRGKNEAGFDFAIAEACQAYRECDAYTDVYGSNVIEIEYNESDEGDPLEIWQEACELRGNRISVIYRDVDVVTPSDGDYEYREC